MNLLEYVKMMKLGIHEFGWRNILFIWVAVELAMIVKYQERIERGE